MASTSRPCTPPRRPQHGGTLQAPRSPYPHGANVFVLAGPLWSWAAASLSSHTLQRPGQAGPYNSIHNTAFPSSQPPTFPLASDTHIVDHLSFCPPAKQHHRCPGPATQCYVPATRRFLINTTTPTLGTIISLVVQQPHPASSRSNKTFSSQAPTDTSTTSLRFFRHLNNPPCLSIGLTSSASPATSRPTAPPTAPNHAVWPTTRRPHQRPAQGPARQHSPALRTNGPLPSQQRQAPSSTSRRPSTSAAHS